MEDIQHLQSGKTCPEHSVATKVKISDASLKNSQKSSGGMFLYLDLRMEDGHMLEKSWEMVTASRGECLTRNIGESPSAARESTLSQILQANAPGKYYLSPRACLGILRRAEKREKPLPGILEEALREAIAWTA